MRKQQNIWRNKQATNEEDKQLNVRKQENSDNEKRRKRKTAKGETYILFLKKEEQVRRMKNATKFEK